MQVTTLLDIPDALVQGLADGTYSRIGGTVRHVQTGRIVALLREAAPATDLLSAVTPVVGILNLGVSVLNLGVSVVGFIVVIDRLGQLEKELQNTKEVLLKSNQDLSRKIDLSFYANFAAALKLAQTAFTMSDVENRKAAAFQAINRFLEAEVVYHRYASDLLKSKTRGSEQYLLTLAFAYIAEIRCHLELREIYSAQSRFREVVAAFRPLVKRYIEILLTSKPCVYLHSEVEDETSLTRLTRIMRWLKQDESIDENAVFQRNRDAIFTLHRESDNWKSTLPDTVSAQLEFKGFPATFKQLPKLMDKMESMIETFQRLEAYEQEIQVMQQLGLNFQDWAQLTTPAPMTEIGESHLKCILVPEMVSA